MKKIPILGLLLLGCLASLTHAQQISRLMANKAAQHWVNHHESISIYHTDVLANSQGDVLAYTYNLSPAGYLVFSADQSLPPVIAYSLNSVFSIAGELSNPLQDMLILDLGIRMKHLDLIPEDEKEWNRSHWAAILEQLPDNNLFEQWPPPGSTSTGGWLETNWSQGHPYNKFCPMDNVNNARSVAGCPAVALSMIIHYQENLNGTQFSDTDDYYHSYAGRQYWIDDDSHGWDFPPFPDLNEYFDSIEIKFQSQTPLTEDEIAALVFGCGVAAIQVYTSTVSGTFGVDQAYDAYLRFGYEDAQLIYDSDTSFYTQMKDNIKEALPVHLAVLSSTGQGGHNVVADGYNTDDYYHLNFGWGGSYNGWYLLPDEIPYNLTIIEGAVVDIGITNVAIPESSHNKLSNISIFPNPVKDKMRISCPDLITTDGVVKIISLDGRELHEKQMNNGNASREIDLSDLLPGVYLCQLIIDEKNVTIKIIKE